MIVRPAILAVLPLLQIAPDRTLAGGGEFGRSLAVVDVDGDGVGELLVGAPDQDAAFLFVASSDVPSWTVRGPSRFGFRVARAGDVNGDGFEDAAVADLDRTSVYLGSAAGLATAAAWTAPGSVPAGVGDVNGDGFDDLAVGNPSGTLGTVDVYFGSASGLATTPAWNAVDGQAFSGFGASIAAAGDVDGDGFDDVLIGSPGRDQATPFVDIDVVYYVDDVLDPVDFPVGAAVVPDVGRAWLFAGSADGPERRVRWTEIGTPSPLEGFGLGLAGGSDLDGDGRPDAVAVSARAEVVAFYADGSALSLAPNWIHVARRVDSATPAAAGAGDVNGDGVGDVVVVDRLSLRVFEGPALATGPSWEVDEPAEEFAAVLAVGDLNGDGLDDLATSGNGTVRIFFGAASSDAPAAAEPEAEVLATAGRDDRSPSDGCGLLGLEALLALAYLSSRMRRARNQTSSP